jgi:hypothetical protein
MPAHYYGTTIKTDISHQITPSTTFTFVFTCRFTQTDIILHTCHQPDTQDLPPTPHTPPQPRKQLSLSLPTVVNQQKQTLVVSVTCESAEKINSGPNWPWAPSGPRPQTDLFLHFLLFFSRPAVTNRKKQKRQTHQKQNIKTTK